MPSKIAVLACALTLALSASAWAQPSTPSLDEGGRIARIDEANRVIWLESGRVVRITPDTVILVNGQPVSALTTLQPGQTVVIRSGEPVVYQGGRYVVVTPPTVTGTPGTAVPPAAAGPSGSSGTVVAPGATVSPGTTVVTPAPPAPGTTVVTPGGVAVVTPPATVVPLKRTIYGSVIDVDPGEIKVKTDGGDFEVKMPQSMTSQIRKGDGVQFDMTIVPGTSPSALPR